MTQTGGNGDSSATGQTASSTTWRGGVVGNYAWGERAATAGGVGFGLWGQHEGGSVTGPASSTSNPGTFTTNSVILGISIGGRGNSLW